MASARILHTEWRPSVSYTHLDVYKRQRYPDAWNLNNFAQFACAAGDREETAKLIRRLGDEPDPQVWRTPGQFERGRDGDIGPLKVRPRKDVPGRTTRG